MDASDKVDGFCGKTVRRALDLLGGKWTMLILWELLEQERRYAALQRRVAGISQKVLSAELRSLVAAGLVEREVAATTPPQVTYRITAEGRGAAEAYAALHRWGARPQASRPPVDR